MWYLPLLAAVPLAAPEVPFLVGTYTTPEGSRGILRSTLNPQTGALSAVTLATPAENPSYQAWHPNGKFLYSVFEFTGGDVGAFALQDDQGLKPINVQRWRGGGPCHLAVHPTGSHLLVAAYGGGSLGVFPIAKDGSLQPVSDEFQNAGKGPNQERQEGPHMHMAAFSPDGRFALACDLGTDEVLNFAFDAKTGKLEKRAFAKMKPGAGPRHLVFGAKGAKVYVNNELDNTVTVLARNVETGDLRPIQTLPSLPADFTAFSKSSEIVLHPTEKWLYVSNRGHDSVAVYAVQRDGTLKLGGIDPAQVKEPRGMDLDPSGKWMVIGGQNSDDLVSLPVDPKTGRLGTAVSRVKAGRPVSVLFRRGS